MKCHRRFDRRFGVVDAGLELDTDERGTQAAGSQVPIGGRQVRETDLAGLARNTRGESRVAVSRFQPRSNEHRMSTRSSIVMAAVTISALAVSAAAVIGAFLVLDQHAAQILQSEPRIVPVEKKAAPSTRSSRVTARNSDHQTDLAAPASRPRLPTQRQTVGSAASASAAGPPPASRQSSASEPRPAADTMVDSQRKRRTEADRSDRRHGRRLARSSREQQDGGEAVSSAQSVQGGGQSALFFPFR